MLKIFDRCLYVTQNIRIQNKITKFLNKFNSKNIITKYCKTFCDKPIIINENKSISKIVKIEFDENNNKKYILQDFDEHLKTNPEQPKPKKIKNLPSKFKFFGSENENSLQSDENNENDPSFLVKEEVEENLITYSQYFSDSCRLYVKAGDGGNGSLSILKGPMFSDRTPQGGDGGQGGDIIFLADDTVSSLSSLRKSHIFGNDGIKGTIKSQGGSNGKDITIHLPVGTIVNEIIRDEKYSFKKRELRVGAYQTKLLLDLDEPGKSFVVVQGGRKGIGNSTKRNINADSPQLKGKFGEEKELELILKCYADIGLVGFPNAGKSTLLAALTRAVPKIAPYAFTTLHPHIGKLRFYDSFTLTIADLPGLIEGAHINKGLGHKFLKHIERTKILIFVLDGSLDPFEKRSPLNDLITLFNELSMFNKSYIEKPFLLVLNKCDVEDENYKKNLELLNSDNKFLNKEIVSISANYGSGLEVLSQKIRNLAENIALNKNIKNI